MKKLTLFFALALTALVFSANLCIAADVDEIVHRANMASYYGADDGTARAKMAITSGTGQERSREFTILRLDKEDGGDQFYYVYFHKPGDVKKTVFMVHKKVGGDDDRWLYLPALDLVKRIGATDKRTSFVGAHYFYEDVSGRGIAEDTHVLTEETDTSYVLDNTPKKPDEVEFASYRLWIDKTTYLPMKAEYKNGKGEVYRIVEALEVETISGVPTVVKSRVHDVESGGETVMTFSKIAYNVGLKESLFTERYLRKPPRKHIKR
jgi:outer membrane lipoprotein-sorting protein